MLVAAHTAWLWLLLPAARAGAREPVAAAGLGVFVLLYLLLVAVPVVDLPVSSRLHHAGLALHALLGTALAAAFTGVSDGGLIVLLYVCSAGAVGLTRPAAAFGWTGGSVAAVLVIGAVHRSPAGDVVPTALITALAGASTIGFVRLARLVEELRRTQQELARTVVERERLRFAQDLHDLLGHTLSLIVVKAEVVRRLAPADPARAATEAADIERIGRTALGEVREAVTGYREQGFGRELANARTVLDTVGIAVTVRGSGHPLSVEADEAFRWVLREGVTNVLRHSGATRCEITVAGDEAGAVLTVRDNGVGGRPEPGNGLRGLAERLERAGGSIGFGRPPGGGLELTARLPAPVPT
ncbi:two-component system, NarL family, sensor histidine kinase DesK [Micromonospora mirobrigensis]|uniref:Two-component system, NarL family, sensor histidine kinase DesK n=1 Tax=Micromonospora mirobrigensis TaxID=262898 RepID=A0A1C5A7P8_9ACTN|nr:two-component system, NarL family, sensor histidine kinase DesK [Micromonospora mirobrigensis]